MLIVRDLWFVKYCLFSWVLNFCYILGRKLKKLCLFCSVKCTLTQNVTILLYFGSVELISRKCNTFIFLDFISRKVFRSHLMVLKTVCGHVMIHFQSILGVSRRIYFLLYFGFCKYLSRHRIFFLTFSIKIVFSWITIVIY